MVMPVAIAIGTIVACPWGRQHPFAVCYAVLVPYGKTNQTSSSRQASQSGGAGRILRDSRRGRNRKKDRRAEAGRSAPAAGRRCPGCRGGSFRGWSSPAGVRSEPGNFQSAERAFRQAGGGSEPPGFRASGRGAGAKGAAAVA